MKIEAARESVYLIRIQIGETSAYMTEPQARELLAKLQASMMNDEKFGHKVKRLVAEEFECSVASLTTPKRSDRLAVARWVAYRIMGDIGGMKFSEIGKQFNRTWGAVEHGVKQLQIRIETERGDAIKCSIERIKEALKNS